MAGPIRGFNDFQTPVIQFLRPMYICMVCDWQGLGAECRVEVEVEVESGGCWRRGVRSGGAVEMGGVRVAVSRCWQAGTSSVAASRTLP